MTGGGGAASNALSVKRGPVKLVATRDHVIIVRPGDTVHTPPGEEHWHGALPDHFMTHLAMWEDDDANWGSHVTDEEYAAATTTDRPVTDLT